MQNDFDSSVFAKDTIQDFCLEFNHIIQYVDDSSKVKELLKLRKRIVIYIDNESNNGSDIKPLPLAEFMLTLVNQAIKSFY